MSARKLSNHSHNSGPEIPGLNSGGREQKRKRGRGKEGKRERGKEGKRERGKEGKRERGKEEGIWEAGKGREEKHTSKKVAKLAACFAFCSAWIAWS
jgi:hypothetical protein